MLRRSISAIRFEPTNPEAPVTNVVFNQNTPSINSSARSGVVNEKQNSGAAAMTWGQSLIR
jgi:hypothetical protein